MNAELNQAGNIEWRQGSWYEPVAGEQFDLIVANPPYVLSPSSDYVYRDAGPAGGVVGHVIAGAAEHLAPGGVACILANWPERDDDWSGCRASGRRRRVAMRWSSATPRRTRSHTPRRGTHRSPRAIRSASPTRSAAGASTTRTPARAPLGWA